MVMNIHFMNILQFHLLWCFGHKFGKPTFVRLSFSRWISFFAESFRKFICITSICAENWNVQYHRSQNKVNWFIWFGAFPNTINWMCDFRKKCRLHLKTSMIIQTFNNFSGSVRNWTMPFRWWLSLDCFAVVWFSWCIVLWEWIYSIGMIMFSISLEPFQRL